ncbi:MAG: hypothetical protein ABI200_02855 [Gaiellales bacterium]
MGSVNSNARVALPTTAAALPANADAQPADEQQPAADTSTAPDIGGGRFTNGLVAMGSSIGSVITDTGSFVGVATHEDGSLKAGIDIVGLGGAAAVVTGPSALLALGGRINPLDGSKISYAENFGSVLATNTVRITPTLISAVLGPAAADGVSMLAPNLVKKYTDTRLIKDADAKKQADRGNQMVKLSRAVAGGATVGLVAGAAFLIEPELFKKFGAGVSHALEGSTAYTVNGVAGKLTGVLDEAAIGRQLLLGAGDKLEVLKTVAPMARDAMFSNRAIVASAGGIGTLLMVNAAAGEQDPGKQKLMWGLAAGTGALTVGATWGVGKLTQGSIRANGGAGGLLAKNQLLMKPNIEWVKKFTSTIAPITAFPAGTAASQYFNIVDDFETITATKSPFRK